MAKNPSGYDENDPRDPYILGQPLGPVATWLLIVGTVLLVGGVVYVEYFK